MASERLITLTLIITFFLFIMLFWVQEVVAQNLRICEEGIKVCEQYISDKSTYKECLQRECNQKRTEPRSYFEITDQYESIELIETCDYGLRKCEALSEDRMVFWECVRDSCENPPEHYSPRCDEGEKSCVKKLKVFNDCLTFNCPNPGSKVEYCPRGKRNCESALREYWQCVYGVCLGDVSKYRENRVYRKYIRVKDSKGNINKIRIDKIPPTLAGVPEIFKDPPGGINREEWVRDIPSRYLITGNPSKSLVCYRPYETIKCYSNDIRSCICSDGSIPIFRKGPPQPITMEEWEANE